MEGKLIPCTKGRGCLLSSLPILHRPCASAFHVSQNINENYHSSLHRKRLWRSRLSKSHR